VLGYEYGLKEIHKGGWGWGPRQGEEWSSVLPFCSLVGSVLLVISRRQCFVLLLLSSILTYYSRVLY